MQPLQGTQLYDPKAGGWRDLGMLDVMQVIFMYCCHKLDNCLSHCLVNENHLNCFVDDYARSLVVLGDHSLTRVVKASYLQLMTNWLII